MMLYSDRHFKEEFGKIERLTKLVGIPLFTVFSTLFLMPYPFEFEIRHYIFQVLMSLIGVVSIWFSIRFIIIIIRDHFDKVQFSFRLAFQLILTLAVTIFIIWILDKAGDRYLLEYICPQDIMHYFDSKNLYLVAIIFALLINTVYEIFYLMMRLSDKALETERYKKASIEAQYQNLTSRLNPHFLFNSLNTLTTIVEEDSARAVSYIKELSTVYRYVLNSQKLTWADLNAEMKFTHSYITLLKMRFEDKLVFKVDICEKYLQYHILAMTIQLLIENAVKHNEISSNHSLTVKVYCEDERLIVTNNKQLRKIMPATTKVGLHTIIERYKFLVNKEVIIEDMMDTFTVKIPLVRNIDGISEHIEDYSNAE